MKTYKHKTNDILATIDGKTCYMSTMSGKIYKQFPAEHLKVKCYEEAEFPGNFDESFSAFRKSYEEKRQAAEKRKEQERKAAFERKRKEYDERKRLLKMLLGMRRAWQRNEDSIFYAVCNQNGYDIGALGEDNLDPQTEYEDGYPKFFATLNEAEQAFEQATTDAHPEQGRENYIELYCIHFYEEALEYTTKDAFNQMLYDSDSCSWVKSEILKEEYIGADYDNIEGAVIVEVSWETHLGYCMNFHGIRYGEYKETERDIVSMNSKRTFRPWEFVVCKADEIKDLSDEDKLEWIWDSIPNYPWNHFKHSLTRKKIIEQLNLKVQE